MMNILFSAFCIITDLTEKTVKCTVPCKTSSGPSKSHPLPPSQRGLGWTNQSKTVKDRNKKPESQGGVVTGHTVTEKSQTSSNSQWWGCQGPEGWIWVFSKILVFMLLLSQWQESHGCYPGPQESGVIKAKAAVVSHPPFPWRGSDEMAAWLLWALIQIGITSFPEYTIPGKELASNDFYHLCRWKFCHTSWPWIIS